MPQVRNRHGLQFTAAGDVASAAFDGAVMNYLSFSKDTGASLKALLAADPDMPMAQCLRGYFFMLMGVGALVGKARQDAQRLLAIEAQLNPRERLHARALDAWTNHSLGRATALWQQIATLHPRDVLAIKMAHFGHFYVGDSRNVRDGVAAVLDFWSPEDDAYSYLQSMYAFGLEECGNPWQAEAVGREALARQPSDPWGIHAVAHALEATGRTAEGVAWIDTMAGQWHGINNFRYHVAWHKALFRFESGDYTNALLDYDQIVYSDGATEYLDACNDASMLLRLELAGTDVGDRWRAVAAKVASRTEERVLAFADLHFVLALTSSPEPEHRELAQRMVGLMEAYAQSEAADAGLYRLAAVPAAKGLVAFRQGRHADAVQGLAEAAPHLYRVGGSHAQRDLFAGVRAEAAFRADRGAPDTLALLAARTRSHPHNRRGWTLYLDALEQCGDASAIAAARRRMTQT
ncbi:MAG: tetratricopeptide repeat protein [Proteobacteria bacterium]|nr:tetratricopeptide repeat protein [Pseudomonadota bacterium]